ncbi:copper homeostasis protein CutC, partial [Romboutsia sp.]|uniref:copper homeostasis protein CutC n=1 Tax=Romboutsia sp. TaxID=1965302 RepID=UPI003F2F76E3
MLEIIALGVEDAKTIESCGANRIELVSALTEGGLTPSFGLIEKIVNTVNIPVNVMIRPHANSFVYSEYDMEIMLKDIEIVKSLGANGIVFGSLTKEGNLHKAQLEQVIKACSGLDFTYHRAIDDSKDILNNTKLLREYSQITSVLTSGGPGKVPDNMDTVVEIVNNTLGKEKTLLGSGLNLENIEAIKKASNAVNFHFGTAVRVNNSPFERIDEEKLTSLVKKL